MIDKSRKMNICTKHYNFTPEKHTHRKNVLAYTP